MRARRGTAVLGRVADQLLAGSDVEVPRLWGERGRHEDVSAERERIRGALHQAHQRRARRRRLVIGLVRLG
ncbi:MAG: hypothetical protein QOI54_1234 [Actinomycetota bacterium]|jgi:hypothetical protein|nr:hypothetical protein [Actinomycetota bacterium]